MNGIKVTAPSYLLRPGDVITVRARENLQGLYRVVSEESVGETLDWITFDTETLRATVQGLPAPTDISVPLDANEINMVIELLSR